MRVRLKNERLRSRGRIFMGALCLLLTVGCGSKDKEQPAGEGGRGQAASGQKAGGKGSAPATKPLEVPAAVTAYGGTSAGLVDFLKGAGEMVTAITGQPLQVDGMATNALQGELVLSSAKGLDMKGSLRVVFFDDKTYRKGPMAAMMPITDQATFAGSLPKARLKENDAGNAYSYLKDEGAKTPVYVNFIGKHAVITRHPELFGKFKGFFAELGEAPLGSGASMIIRLDHVLAIHGERVDAALAKMSADMKSQMQAMGNAAEGQIAIIESMLQWIGASIKELESVAISFEIGKEGARLSTVLTPKAGAALAGSFKKLEGKPMALLNSFPAETPFFQGISIPMEAFTEFAQGIFKSMLAGQEGSEGMAASMVQLMEAFSGEMAVASPPGPNGQGLSLAALMGLKPGKGDSFVEAMGKMYSDPAYVAANEKMGIKVDFDPAALEIAGVKVARAKTTMANLPPEAMMMGPMMDFFTEQYFAVKGDVMYVSYGPDAKAVLEPMLSGKMSGGLAKAKGPKRGLDTAAPNAFTVMYISPVELAKRLSLGGMNPFVALLQGIETETGLTISTGSAEGKVHLVVDIPTELGQKSFEAFQKGKGAF